ncbi:1265_t:CDS:2, partial [Acaulospora colombiana]
MTDTDLRVVVAIAPKTNTVLQYDSEWNVIHWGVPALACEPQKKKRNRDKTENRPVELFKLYLADISLHQKPNLPYGLDYRKAIRDYLAQMRPAGALYCMKKLGEHRLTAGDCGGGTVDLTTRQLLTDGSLSEITERTGDLCGSTYVDDQFKLFLKKKLGQAAVELFETKHYGQYQYLIHDFFCPRVKCVFTGNQEDFKVIELDIEKRCPALIDYVTDEIREEMENEEWLIEINFQDVLNMFYPVVDKIIILIRNQLNASKQECSAMFLVGGFVESPYLVKRIRERFSDEVPLITVPQHPITAVLRGAVIYGLNKKSVANRMLTMNYGIEVYPKWKKGVDPKKRQTEDGRIAKFNCLAMRGRVVASDEKCSGIYYPIHPAQTSISFKIFATPKPNQRFCNEPGMKEIGELKIDLPDVHLGLDRPVEFGLYFGELLITATACNQKNGK